MNTNSNTTARVKLVRFKKNDNCVFSWLYVDDVFICYAFENLKLMFKAGSYHLFFTDSIHFKGKLWHIYVPGHTGIEIHPANAYTQLRGCVAPVSSIGVNGGNESRIALAALTKAIGNVTVSSIEVIESFQV